MALKVDGSEIIMLIIVYVIVIVLPNTHLYEHLHPNVYNLVVHRIYIKQNYTLSKLYKTPHF